MSATAHLRRQHEELVNLVGEISGHLDSRMNDTTANSVFDLLTTLTGKVKLHLAMEDNSLYPRMIESPIAEAAETARKFQTEMGDLSKVYLDYANRWNSPRSIGQDASTFIAETKAVFNALGKRIERENTQLYPLADTI